MEIAVQSGHVVLRVAWAKDDNILLRPNHITELRKTAGRSNCSGQFGLQVRCVIFGSLYIGGYPLDLGFIGGERVRVGG